MEITCNIYATYAGLHVSRFSDKMCICSAPENVYDAYFKKHVPYYVTVYIHTNGTTKPYSIVVTYKLCAHFQFHFYSPMYCTLSELQNYKERLYFNKVENFLATCRLIFCNYFVFMPIIVKINSSVSGGLNTNTLGYNGL
jgi:hypothetical protein